ncbi:MAG: AAA family ATPase, partial [Duncaniella sp.]|nr:AAA family ATPase [Duncaniella sp.]
MQIADKILSYLEYTPLRGQLRLVNALADFALQRGSYDLFLLNGYAGTGKTSIVGAFIKTMAEIGQNVVLLAPTGRAAKVAASFAGIPAQTIHKRIFRPDVSTPDARYFAIPNTDKNT